MQFNDTYRLHIIPDGKELGFAISESLLTQLTMLHRENVQMILKSLVDDN